MKALTVVLGVFAFIAALVLLLTLPTYLLWNWLMPTIFGLPEITILQSLGLLLLSNILFKSFGATQKSKN